MYQYWVLHILNTMSQDDEPFDFGQVAQSIYIQLKEQRHQLPYNPFQFDLHLTLIASREGYEAQGTQFPLGKPTMFGRSKDSLRNEMVSRKHFSISSDYILMDEGSKKGTFILVRNWQQLCTGDMYRVGVHSLSFARIEEGEIIFNGQSVKMAQLVVGSHPKCNLVVQDLFEYEVSIDVTKRRVKNLAVDAVTTQKHGLWRKLREGEKYQLDQDSIIFVQPYIFAVNA